MNTKQLKQLQKERMGFIKYHWMQLKLFFDIQWQIEKYEDEKELKKELEKLIREK